MLLTWTVMDGQREVLCRRARPCGSGRPRAVRPISGVFCSVWPLARALPAEAEGRVALRAPPRESAMGCGASSAQPRGSSQLLPPAARAGARAADGAPAAPASPAAVGDATDSLTATAVATPAAAPAPSNAPDFSTLGVSLRLRFAWYFPAVGSQGSYPHAPNHDAPLLMWLQGGPGGSSMFGLFVELGPFRVTASNELEPMPHTWCDDKYSCLFIDNPVGAGFSYTTADDGYCEDTKVCVSRNLWNLLQQWYTVFPEWLDQDLYITGESYAGHYVPGIGAFIDEMNDNATESGNLVLPLAGVAIGDGWVDPVEMVRGYADLFTGFSLANLDQRTRIETYQDTMLEAILEGRMYDAFCTWDEFLNGDVYQYQSYFTNITGSTNYDNLARTSTPPEFSRYAGFLARPDVRRAIHVGNATFNDGSACERHLLADFMVSLKPQLARLMDRGYAVIVYSGQLDIIVASPLTERYLPTIPWSGSEELAAATKMPWRVSPDDGEVAGFVQAARTFTRAVVRSAGHILPFDQPRAARDMLGRWVAGEAPFAARAPRPQPKPRARHDPLTSGASGDGAAPAARLRRAGVAQPL